MREDAQFCRTDTSKQGTLVLQIASAAQACRMRKWVRHTVRHSFGCGESQTLAAGAGLWSTDLQRRSACAGEPHAHWLPLRTLLPQVLGPSESRLRSPLANALPRVISVRQLRAGLVL